MKSLCLLLAAGVSAVAFASAAQAADLIVETPVVPGVVDVGGNWDGAFVGVFAGYGWAEPEFEAGGPDGVEPAGWLLGVSAGANFTLTDGIVAGVVGDIAWADINDDIDVPFRLPPSSPPSTGRARCAAASASTAAPSCPT